MSKNRIIVTGCSGFVGRNLSKELIRQGYDVIGFSRTDPNIKGLTHIPFDITDKSNYRTKEYTKDTIINTAALTKDGKEGDFREINYEAVLDLLSLNPEGKFIQLSSSSVYDLSKASVDVSETAFSVGSYKFYNPYSETKALADAAIMKEIVPRKVPPLILRPHAIYGEDDTTLLPMLMERIKEGSVPLPDGGKMAHSLTNVKNLIQAIILAIHFDSDKVETFNVADSNPVTIAHAVHALAGEEVKITSVPTKLLLGFMGRALGVSPYEIRQLGYERTYNITKAQNLLSYKPKPFELDWL